MDILARVLQFGLWLQEERMLAEDYPEVQDVLSQIEERYVEFFRDYLSYEEEE